MTMVSWLLDKGTAVGNEPTTLPGFERYIDMQTNGMASWYEDVLQKD